MTEVTCTRATTIANALDDKGGLQRYWQATAIRTLVAHPELLQQAQLVAAKDGAWQAYKPLVARLEEKGGGVEAQRGTNIHGAVEALVSGTDIKAIPAELRAPAESILAEVRRLNLEVAMAERFVVGLDLLPEPVAGTADLVLWSKRRKTYVIGDIKTVDAFGKAKFGAVSWCMQVAIYANSKPWNGAGEVRRDRWNRPLVDPADVGEWDAPMHLGAGVVLEAQRDSGEVQSHRIDLTRGLEYAALACQVRAARKDLPLL